MLGLRLKIMITVFEDDRSENIWLNDIRIVKTAAAVVNKITSGPQALRSLHRNFL